MKPAIGLVATGSALYLYGARALAIPEPAPMSPELSTWLQIVSGLVIALVGAYAKGLSERITKTERDIDVLRQALNLTQINIAAEHHTKAEANEQFRELKASIAAVHARLDYLKLPHAGPKE